jgi:ribose transport system substrate-binding protein
MPSGARLTTRRGVHNSFAGATLRACLGAPGPLLVMPICPSVRSREDNERMTMSGTRWAARGVAGALAALSLLAAAGCSSSTSTDSSAATAGSTTGGDRQLQAKLAADYKGTFSTFPAAAPKPKVGVSLWVISLNEASPGVHSATQSIVAASNGFGWKTRVVDTKGAPSAATAGIKQAIAANARVIVLNVIECGVVESAAKQAKAAGILLIGTTAADCDAPNVGHQALLDAAEGFAPGGFFAFIRTLAQVHVDWVLSQLDGNPGKILVLHQTDYYGFTVHDKAVADGVKQGCPKCDVVNVPFVYSDLNARLKAKVQAALVKNPDAKLMLFPYDATLALGGAAAIQGSGRAGRLKVMGGECAASTVDLIRSGTVTACVGNAYSWLGWQLVDDVNRLLNNQPPAHPSLGMQLVDKTHNLPPSGQDYNGPGTDYATAYKKIWAGAK